MQAVIVRGTTPSFKVDFSEVPGYPDFDINNISSVSLILKRQTEKIEIGLSDMTINGNELSYHFTQQQTLGFNAGEIIKVDMHVVVNGERMQVKGDIPDRIRVENTEKNEVMY